MATPQTGDLTSPRLCAILVPAMARTSTFPLVDRLLGGQLAALLRSWHDDDTVSLDEMVYRLRSEHEVTVSRSTVARWLERPEVQNAEVAS